MLDVISAGAAPPHLFTLNLQPTSPPCAQDRMGCSTSSHTSAVDTTRPSAKPEESNGASATGVANDNGMVAEDRETTTADATSADEPAIAVTSVGSTAAAPPAGEEAEATAAAAANPPADSTSPTEAPAADGSPETAAATPDQDAETTPADSETKTVEATDPSE